MLRCRYGYTVVDYHSSYYGPQTEGAVKDFQDKCGIRNQVVYGRVGRTTWMYLIGSDKDLNLGKSSSGGSGGSDSSSSGGGSGGYSSGYAATAAGMAEYAYSRIGDPVTSFFDDPDVKKTGDGKGHYQWCEPFIKYCAKKVGYSASEAEKFTPNAPPPNFIVKGIITSTNPSSFKKGYTVTTSKGGAHWGIVWRNYSTVLVTIQANTDYYDGNREKAKTVYYKWLGNKWQRDDNPATPMPLYGYINTSKI